MGLRGGWTLIRDTIRLRRSKNALRLAGALAFYTISSRAPLVALRKRGRAVCGDGGAGDAGVG
jgi:uncharacterized BrkB/YihY/UPF0761 family membrane protein